MDKLKKIISMCKAAVYFRLNEYKTNFKSALEEIEFNYEEYCDTDEDVKKIMIEKNTIVSIQAYPYTPIGTFVIYHYDPESAITEMLNILESEYEDSSEEKYFYTNNCAPEQLLESEKNWHKLNELIIQSGLQLEIIANGDKGYHEPIEKTMSSKTYHIIDEDIRNQIIEKNTLIEIFAESSISEKSYKVYHYDLDMVVAQMLELLEGTKNK